MDSADGFAPFEADLRRAVRQCAPGANAVTKAPVLAAPHLSRDEVIRRAGDDFADCLLGEEGREGVASFLEKRKPRWAI